MSCCAGELPWEGVGEFLHSRMAFHISSPCLLAFMITDFIIFTADSAFPLAFWMMWTGREMLKVPGFGKQSEFLGCIVRAVIQVQGDWNSMNSKYLLQLINELSSRQHLQFFDLNEVGV